VQPKALQIPESVKLIFYLKPAQKMQVIYIENIIGKLKN